MRASRSRLGCNFEPLRMLSPRNGIVLLYFLFTLLYSIETVKCKHPVSKQLKGPLNVNVSDGAAKMFLTNLYKKYFNETGQARTATTAIPEIIHSVQGTGMIYYLTFLF